MEWRTCSWRDCSLSPDRKVYWSAKAAGESEVCDGHYKMVNARFAHLARDRPHAKPDERFTDKPKPDQEDLEVFETVGLEFDEL